MMKTTIKISLVILPILAYCFILPGGVKAEKLTIVYAQNFDPLSFSDQNEQVRGVLPDLLDEILGKRLGIALEHRVCPWARCQLMVKRGLSDAFFTIPNPERKEYTEISQYPLYTSNFILYTGAKNPDIEELKKIKSLAQLKKRTNLINAYIIGGGWHIKNLQGVKHATTVVNFTKILELLRFNRVDVYVEQAALVRHQIKMLNMQEDILEIPNVMDETHWHLCIGKKSRFTGILPRLNTLMEKMKEDGSLEQIQTRILNKYK